MFLASVSWLRGSNQCQFVVSAGATFQALVMRPRVPSQDDFYQFVENLVYDGNNNNRNRAGIPRVWWEDFYQTVHRCKLSDARYPLEYDNECALDLTINNFDTTENKWVLAAQCFTAVRRLLCFSLHPSLTLGECLNMALVPCFTAVRRSLNFSHHPSLTLGECFNMAHVSCFTTVRRLLSFSLQFIHHWHWVNVSTWHMFRTICGTP